MNKMNIDINATMLPFFSSTMYDTNSSGTLVQLNILDINHNTGDNDKVYEIVNNVYGNPVGIANKHL